MKHLNPTHELVYLFIKQQHFSEARTMVNISPSIPRAADALMRRIPRATAAGVPISHKAVVAALRKIKDQP